MVGRTSIMRRIDWSVYFWLRPNGRAVDIKRVNAGLLEADQEKANELEMGRNLCALSGAYGKHG